MKIQIEIPDTFMVRNIQRSGFDYFVELRGLGVLTEKTRITFSQEHNNPVDNNAVRVYANDIPIGYLLREDALSINSMLPVLHFLQRDGRIQIDAFFVDLNEAKRTPDGRLYREIKVTIKKR